MEIKSNFGKRAPNHFSLLPAALPDFWLNSLFFSQLFFLVLVNYFHGVWLLSYTTVSLIQTTTKKYSIQWKHCFRDDRKYNFLDLAIHKIAVSRKRHFWDKNPRILLQICTLPQNSPGKLTLETKAVNSKVLFDYAEICAFLKILFYPNFKVWGMKVLTTSLPVVFSKCLIFFISVSWVKDCIDSLECRAYQQPPDLICI